MRKLLLILMILTLTVALSADSYAQVSNAAVLFLRIAAGARAAGMGEAFVAVADDATTTHWNPAGLGTYPLASKWFEVKIPDEYRPLRDAVLIKAEGTGEDYKKYDLWAITPEGKLVRFSDDRWEKGDLYEGSRDRSLYDIVKEYTGLTAEEDAAKVDSLVKIVADHNNTKSRYDIDTLAENVLAAIPKENERRDEMDNALVALARSFDLCRVDWDRFENARDNFEKAFKDSNLSSSEIDRILFAVEKATLRFNNETITIPFEINFDGEVLDIEAQDKYVCVGTDGGFYRYYLKNSKGQRFTTAEGFPGGRVEHIAPMRNMAYLGTDRGVVIFDLGNFSIQAEDRGIPMGHVQAIAAAGPLEAWAVVDGQFYKYDGKVWKDYYVYRDVLDDTIHHIYNNMKIAGTAEEEDSFRQKFDELNRQKSNLTELDSPEVQQEIMALVDSIGMIDAINVLKDSLAMLETGDVFLVESTDDLKRLADSIGIIEAFKLSQKEAEQKAMIAAGDTSAEVGQIIKVPFSVGFPYEITDMAVDMKKNLWVGTTTGLFRFDGRRWNRFGYREYTVPRNQSLSEFALEATDGKKDQAAKLVEKIQAMHQLESNMLDSGRVIMIYANPAGAKINDIKVTPQKIYFATDEGSIMFNVDNEKWERYSEKGLGHEATYAVEEIDGGDWFLTADESQFKGGARGELSLMHVNWLPQLADDIYYEFLSGVFNIRGWGTVGGNITFLSYGNIQRTDPLGNPLGEFSAFDAAITLSYGTPLTSSLSGGLSAKLIYSHLSDQGAGQEKGSGTSWGIALDAGMLYKLGNGFTLGMAVTNFGPDISYIDVAQSDPLPRNAAFGFAWKVIDSRYNRLLITAEANKSLIGITNVIDHFSREMKDIIYNGGAEYWYSDFIAFRAGYIFDEEGDVKTPTLGFGLAYKSFKFDFAYIPSNDDVPLANTMRLSLGIIFE